MLKAKHSCIKLPLLTKHELETLNQSWNCNHMSGDVQIVRNPKNFDERNQRSSKWFFIMITEESSWQIEFHVEQV
jgi:hypothetical protein